MANWYDFLAVESAMAEDRDAARKDDLTRKAWDAIEGVMRRRGHQGPFDPADRRYQMLVRAAAARSPEEMAPDLQTMGWNNAQQAAAAQQAYISAGYDGLRGLGYNLPVADRFEGDRSTLARHLMSPEQFAIMQRQRDADLLSGVLDEGGALRSPDDLRMALDYHQSSLENPFTHSDYASPNYRYFKRGFADGAGNFFNDPQNNVSSAMLGMEVIPFTLLNAADNDTNTGVLDRIGRGMERVQQQRQFRDVHRFGPNPMFRLPNDATAEDRAAALAKLYDEAGKTAPASGQEALHQLGVPNWMNTPAVGMATEYLASAADPTPMGVAADMVASQRAGQSAVRALALDAASDSGINAGMTLATGGMPGRTWSEFFTQPFTPPTDEDRTAKAAATTRSSSQLMGTRGLSSYAHEAATIANKPEEAFARFRNPNPVDAIPDSPSDKIRRLKAMYERPYTGQ